ncbi:YafY family transcriptional regulator [Microvirga sp. STS02]|uniref:helix-turn-helix transcriptional regulator n=1 Tax=Hymenobacter negativus TaxID=2795026 RepID=UPI0018DBEFFB|nr:MULTISPECIES: YafY family protein [Bacteria]MBH8569235.1 YafY family transcriptional regulator [Hymenobacter negativus]MBR7208970.1 YafY family transcriptional regulator [Microvirga sp. STS02]
MNRFDRITAILIQLQTRRVVSGPALAERFGVSLRTVYRDLRTLEQAGVPLFGEPGVGYSLAEGYRLPPVMFTREEATALLTAEKLAARLTDAPTAQLSGAAMDKLRAVLRHADRDHLETLSPHIQVLTPTGPADGPNAYQLLLTAVATQQVVRLRYQAADYAAPETRAVEPIGLYRGRQWHVVAYCRLRQAFRDFRLDRIQHLETTTEVFAARPETLQQHWQAEASRRPREKVVLRFQLAALPPATVQQLHDTKRQYGWAHEQLLPDGRLEMTLLLGSLPYLASWLLPYAGAVAVVEPPALREHLRELAQRAHDFFCAPENMLT